MGGVTLPVFVVDPAALESDAIELAGDEGRHAVVVKRVRVGERVLLTDGLGHAVECRVASVSRKPFRLVAEVLVRRFEPAPCPRLVVVQALVKGEAAELAVDLLTQVGVDAIVPWAASRSVVTWRDERGRKALQRWRSTAREAAKQSRRMRIPELLAVHSTMEVAALVSGAAAGFVLHEGAGAPFSQAPVPSEGDVALVVGPEGGIAEEELSEFAAAGGEPVRLGPSVLRSSAAGVVGAAVLLSRTDRWR